MGKSVKQIRAIITRLDPGMEITDDAAQSMTKIPSFVAGLAIKKTVKRAQKDGVRVIDGAYAAKIKKERFS